MDDAARTAFDFTATTLTGERLDLGAFRGRVLLVVNVASQCGFTPQYAALEALYRKHQRAGLVVLGFPCNQFGHQEPGSPDEIRDACSVYDVTFPLAAKVDVNGPRAHPLFQFLKHARKGVWGTERIKWNFTKFLVGAAGDVIMRYGPSRTPATIEPDVLRALEAAAAGADQGELSR